MTASDADGRPRQRDMSTTQPDVLAAVQEALGVIFELDPGSVGPETRLAADLGADSIALMELAEILEEGYRASVGSAFSIDDADLDDIETVGQVVDYVRRRLAEGMR